MTATVSPLQVDLGKYPYPSRRSAVLAPHGVVSTSQPLAAQAGLRMLLKGGSAADAAVATAIALSVVEATSNGIGSDAFAQVWADGRLHGYNGSGRAPAGLTVDAVRAAGHHEMPERGWLSVSVPGTPRTWADLHARFGRLPFADLFEPAIDYAENGFPVSPLVARLWETAATTTYPKLHGPEFRPWFETFAPGGRAPKAGEIFRSPGHAATLRQIAASNARDFYEGALAEQIDAFSRRTGGVIRGDDLAAHRGDWVEPIRAAYRGYEVCEIPPSGQGIIALMGLNILSGFDVASHPRDSVESYHLQIESLKLGFADARRHVADPQHMRTTAEALLDPAYAAERRKLIGERALLPDAGEPPRGGTVYLCAADADGMMVSYIQSNYAGFGSGVVVPGTGIALQNRAFGFTLEEGHVNQLAPGKRPFHTIIPGFLLRDGEAIGPFGVMGGFMQAQGHLQVMVNTLDYGQNPQTAIDAPRWRFEHGRVVSLERGTDESIAEGLRARGHEVQVLDSGGANFGRGQAIWRLPDGGYAAGSDRRSDGEAVGY